MLLSQDQMTEVTDHEINVDQLMAEIRQAVAKREAEGRMSLAGASVELHRMLSKAGEFAPPLQELSPLALQPEFEPHKNDHYHVNDLLKYHDHNFIWNAYRAILKREPDEAGLREFREELRSGRLNKIDVLGRLRNSPEGRNKGVNIEGLARPAAIRRLYRVPVLGYLLEMFSAIARLPGSLRSQRQFETHALAQQQLLADRINQLSRVTLEVSDSLSRELSELSQEQKDFARLQHEQVAALFREQREILELLKTIQRSAVQLSADSEKTPPPVDSPSGELDEFFAAFTDQFRGDPADIKAGLRSYLPDLQSAGITDGIVDIGSGRGEWLELLKEEKLDARGVEINAALSRESRAKGLDVVDADALAYLRGLPDQSLNAVTAFHFIEHLPFEAFMALLDEIARTLKPGGLVIFETPNPKNLVVGACNFYSDPTHFKPFFPETLHFILGKRGFIDVRLQYVNPVGESPFEGNSKSSEALRSWFFCPRDFAVIGRREI